MTTNKPSSGREGGRSLKTRVKSAGKRTMSSALWLGRQLNDPYVARAKTEGYRSPEQSRQERPFRHHDR